MAVRVGINGFGRIGRSFTRALLARGADAGVELVAVNDPMGDSHTVAFLLKHDSVGGTLANDIQPTDMGFSIDGREIQKLEVMDPAEIPWSDHGVDVVIESTGLFTAREKAAGHLGGSVQARRHLRAERRRRRHDLHGRQRRGLRRVGAHRHLERVVHHQLPGADGQGAQRHLRHRAGPDDHGARLHQRPVAPGPRQGDPQRQARPAPHARRRASRSSRAAPARRRPSASCSPSSRASSTARRCASPCPRVRSPTSPRCSSRAVTIDEINAAFDGRRERQVVPRRARVLRRAARVGRHRRQPVVVHLLRRGHHGRRHAGQGARLVRQRVGLLQPPRRPRRVRRRNRRTSTPARHARRPAAPRRPADRAGSGCWCASTSTCRCRRRGRRRPAHHHARCPPSSGCASEARSWSSCGHLGRPEGRASIRSSRWHRSPRRLGELLGCDVLLAPAVVGPDVEAMVASASPATSCCSRTCASSRARPSNDPAFAVEPLRARRRLRERGVRRVAPRACVDRRPAARSCRTRRVGCCIREVEVLSRLLLDDAERPFVARARRREGRRQARRDRGAARSLRHGADRSGTCRWPGCCGTAGSASAAWSRSSSPI